MIFHYDCRFKNISKHVILVLIYSSRNWVNLNVNDTESHLDELVQGGVGGIVGNEEPHVFVGDLHRGRSVHTSHRDNVEKQQRNPKVFHRLKTRM